MEVPRPSTCRYACAAVIIFGLATDPFLALLLLTLLLLIWAAS